MNYRFGPFTLDSVARRLSRDGDVVPVADRHVDVLLQLLARPGEVVPKESLVQAAWPDVAVTDNSLEQAISILRKVIADSLAKGGQPTGTAPPGRYECAIETVPRRGYRFTGAVTREAARHSDADLEALLAPHRAWLEGRAALETLSVQKVSAAERAFRSVLDMSPHHASAHIGLANALLFRFESTRIDEQPDIAALADAIPHARDGCRLEPRWGEAWATLAFVLHRAGEVDSGMAAARRAVELEPDNWRHHLRLAFIGWGEVRLRAARRTLQLMPGLALAHWLAASVHVARQAFDAAHGELAAGTAAQDEQASGAMFGGIGLHWLAGLLHLRQGDAAEAERHFDRELSFEASGHLYGRECCSGTWYAKGAHAFHRGDHSAAAAAFDEVLRRVPGHPLALAASRRDDPAIDPGFSGRLQIAAQRGAQVDVAVALAVRDAARGREPDTAPIVLALQHAPPGPSGWYLPVEPMVRLSEGSVLALVRSRAS